MALSRLWAGGWRDHLAFVKPATVVGWHGNGCGCTDLEPAYLIHDRDAVYGKKLPLTLAGVGVHSIRTPVRAPRASGIADRVIRTIRQECPDHVIVPNEHHIGAVLKDFMSYYNQDRPHRALLQESPIPAPETARDGPIQSQPVLGGLHHVYVHARLSRIAPSEAGPRLRVLP